MNSIKTLTALTLTTVLAGGTASALPMDESAEETEEVAISIQVADNSGLSWLVNQLTGGDDRDEYDDDDDDDDRDSDDDDDDDDNDDD